MVCVADAEHATAAPVVERRGYDPRVTMTNREVRFVDEDGAKVRIGLR
jgi:hypothetical protein